MNVMFESDQFFVRIKDKGGLLKISIWDSCGDKVLSDVFKPTAAEEFWATVQKTASAQVSTDLQKKVFS